MQASQHSKEHCYSQNDDKSWFEFRLEYGFGRPWVTGLEAPNSRLAFSEWLHLELNTQEDKSYFCKYKDKLK